MKNNGRFCLRLILLLLMITMLWGCGSSTTNKNEDNDTSTPGPTSTLTGDVSLFPNAHLLATAQEVLDHVDGTDSSGMIIIDTRSADAYAAGHIPGAINVDWQDFAIWNDPPEKAVLKSVSELEEQLGALGLSRTSNIVIYDDTTASWGSAGRMFWMLEYLGAINVRILNGGWDKWAADGLETENTVNTLEAASFYADQSIYSSAIVDKDYIQSRLGDDDFVLVDTRTDEEYIGWTLYGEARGGHIEGAVHLPYEKYYNTDKSILSYEDMTTLFESKNITMDTEVAAYCTAGIRSGFFYFMARLMGIKTVANYDGSAWEWAASDEATYPMKKLENYQALVYPAWVDALIKGENPDTYSGNGYVILFTSWAARYSENRTDYVGTPYETGHIPGAIFLDTYSIENGPNSEYGEGYQTPEEGNAKSIAGLQTLFGSLGISKDKTVVVYADDEISMMTAGRIAWSLLLAGVEDVRILNGSYAAWVAYGGDIETTPNTPVAVSFGDSDGGSDYLATTEDLLSVIDNAPEDTVIVDDREWAEFVGDSNSYYHYFHELGRVKTAQWIGDWVEIASADAQSMRDFSEVEDNWLASGFTADKKMLFYCGTGWRSGLYTFYAYLMGWSAANYDGGWFQWSYYDNPRTVGNADKIVSAEWVKNMIDTDNDGASYVIIETGWGPVGSKYNGGHIPGAIWVNTDEIEYDCFSARNDWPVDEGDPACYERSTTEEEDAAKGLGPDDTLPRNWWNIYPDEYLLPAFAYMGVDKNTTVVVYGKGGSAAARIVWAMMYAGVADVRLFEGGKDEWTGAGYELELTENLRTPVDYFDPDDPTRTTVTHPEFKVDIPYVRTVVSGETENALLVDIRDYEEYIGASRPYSYIPTDGRVPGAVWGTDTLGSPSGIYPFWNLQGINGEKHLSFYCGTAWRSSLAWLYAYIMGFSEISNFDSSWFEWSMGEGSAYSGADPVLNLIEDDSPDLP